jgi:hypothetical protein
LHKDPIAVIHSAASAVAILPNEIGQLQYEFKGSALTDSMVGHAVFFVPGTDALLARV